MYHYHRQPVDSSFDSATSVPIREIVHMQMAAYLLRGCVLVSLFPESIPLFLSPECNLKYGRYAFLDIVDSEAFVSIFNSFGNAVEGERERENKQGNQGNGKRRHPL